MEDEAREYFQRVAKDQFNKFNEEISNHHKFLDKFLKEVKNQDDSSIAENNIIFDKKNPTYLSNYKEFKIPSTNEPINYYKRRFSLLDNKEIIHKYTPVNSEETVDQILDDLEALTRILLLRMRLKTAVPLRASLGDENAGARRLPGSAGFMLTAIHNVDFARDFKPYTVSPVLNPNSRN